MTSRVGRDVRRSPRVVFIQTTHSILELSASLASFFLRTPSFTTGSPAECMHYVLLKECIRRVSVCESLASCVSALIHVWKMLVCRGRSISRLVQALHNRLDGGYTASSENLYRIVVSDYFKTIIVLIISFMGFFVEGKQ